MPAPTITDYLKYADLQMAAEAFIRNESTGELATSTDAIVAALKAGNNHSLIFTETQATEFAAQWEVVDQRANTATGFSGTLFRSKVTDPAKGLIAGQLVLSFRSTEFIDDNLRDSAATNDAIFSPAGWAFWNKRGQHPMTLP